MQTLLLCTMTTNWYNVTCCGHNSSSLFFGEQYIHRSQYIYWAYYGSAKIQQGTRYTSKSYRDRNRYSYRYRLASYRYRDRCGPFLLPLSPMLSLSGVVQTSEYNLHPFKFKTNGIRDSFQLFNPKRIVKFQIAYKWQLALL